MAHLTLEFPDEIRSKLVLRARQTGYPSLEEYVEKLLRSEADVTGIADEDFGAPEHLTTTSGDQLEALLMEGEASGRATEMTAEEWESIRKEVAARIAANRSGHE